MGSSSKTSALYSAVLHNMEMPSTQVSSDLYSVATHTLQENKYWVAKGEIWWGFS